MGTGSSKLKSGGGGLTEVMGIDKDGYMDVSSVDQEKLNEIVAGLKPNPTTGHVMAKDTNKAGKAINKMMNQDDKLIGNLNDGTTITYQKWDDGWFLRNGQGSYDSGDVGRFLANHKDHATFTIKRKVPQAQKDRMADIASKVATSGGKDLKFAMTGGQGGMTFLYHNAAGKLVQGTINKDGAAKVLGVN